MISNEIRVRFAPSPTGWLHIGGLRTALYNFLFARRHGGKFILRIEDTDRSRLVENAVESLIDSLSWAGIQFDESPAIGGKYGPYIQSQRLEIYRSYAQQLVNLGKAYFAFDSPEEIEAMRLRLKETGSDTKYDRRSMRNQLTLGDAESRRLIESGSQYVVRLKVPSGREVVFNDIIRGRVSVASKEIDDQVLMKSDGYPTYHLANVVDDHLMSITHVIRGEEWLPSTPKHVLLYEAFGWEMPEFAHLPLLLNNDKSKLSKRQGDVAVEDYRAKGYLKEAIVNFVALLGFNPTADRELYTIDELIESFDLKKVNKGGAVFDLQKLDWMNAQYLRSMPQDRLAVMLAERLSEVGLGSFSADYLQNVVSLFKERVSSIPEMIEFAGYMFAQPKEYDLEYLHKHWNEATLSHIESLTGIFRSLGSFSHAKLHDITIDYCERSQIKLKEVIHPLRLMITGKSGGAGMFETMEALGKAECLNRLDAFIVKIKVGTFSF